MKRVTSKSALYLLKNYPFPGNVIDLGLELLQDVLRKVSRGKFERTLAKTLFEAAECSIGIGEGKESLLLEIKYLVSGIER